MLYRCFQGSKDPTEIVMTGRIDARVLFSDSSSMLEYLFHSNFGLGGNSGIEESASTITGSFMTYTIQEWLCAENFHVSWARGKLQKPGDHLWSDVPAVMEE